MEIRDYLRAIRRILPLLIILPIVAAAITGFLLEKQPSKYEAKATVVVPAISGNGTSQSAASQYVDTFKDVLISQPVIADVSQKFNIPTAELVTGLSADTITASSNIINVTLIGEHGQNLTGAVREATVESMDWIARPQLLQAQNEVSTAQTLLQNADTAIANFGASTGNYSPQLKYNDEQSALSNQEVNLTRAQLAGDKAGVALYTANITKISAQLAQYAQQLQTYKQLSNAESAALAASDHANIDLVSAQALVATDQDPSTVTVVNVGRLSKLSDVIKFAGIAFALALLMLLGFILILELMRSGRRPAVAADTEQGAFAWSAAPPASSQAEASPATATPTGTSSRDPWRPAPSAPAAPISGGDGNGDGHSTTPEVATESEQTSRGLLRRR